MQRAGIYLPHASPAVLRGCPVQVGMSYPSALYFHELDTVDASVIDGIIACNVNATTQMTRLVVDGMVKRKRGAIVSISSAAGRVPIGACTLYC